MHMRILIVAVLSVIATPAAFAKEPPVIGTQADESELGATLEIFDQKKVIKLACGTFQVQVWAPAEDDKGDSTNVDCGGVAIDPNSPLLWDYANKKQRVERAVLSYKTRKGQPYAIEMPNVTIAHVNVLSDTLDINLYAASSQLIVPPRRQ